MPPRAPPAGSRHEESNQGRSPYTFIDPRTSYIRDPRREPAHEPVPGRDRSIPRSLNPLLYRADREPEPVTSPRGGENYDIIPGQQGIFRNLGHSLQDARPIHQDNDERQNKRRDPRAPASTPNDYPHLLSAPRRPSDHIAAQPTTRSVNSGANLSVRARDFLMIKAGKYDEIRSFVARYKDVLEEKDSVFMQEAGQAYGRGETQYARAAIQQALIIRKCSDLEANEVDDYLEALAKHHKRTLLAFVKDFDVAFDAVKKRVDALGQSSTNVYPSAPSARPAARHTEQNDRPSTMAAANRRRPSTYSDDAGMQNTLTTQMAAHSITDRHHHGTTQLPASGYKTSANVNKGKRHDISDIPRQSTSNHAGKGSIGSVILENVEFRGTAGEREKLDPSYKQRTKEAVSFFKVGRVFAILWHENVSANTKPGDDVGFDKPAPGRYGERIFSHIRRMVVVRNKTGYCWCIPINSYGGRGVAEKKRGIDETEAHTIVFDSNKRAQLVDGESRNSMTKDPIAIDMVEGETLDSASRLNFAKVHTVEHNVKVKNIGKVAPSHLDFLVQYWREEMNT